MTYGISDEISGVGEGNNNNNNNNKSHAAKRNSRVEFDRNITCYSVRRAYFFPGNNECVVKKKNNYHYKNNKIDSFPKRIIHTQRNVYTSLLLFSDIFIIGIAVRYTLNSFSN